MLNCRSQGWGQLINLGVLMVGLLAFNGRGGAPYSHGAAGATYRFSFGCIAVLIAWMAYYRTWRMKPVAGLKTEPSKQADKVCSVHIPLNAKLDPTLEDAVLQRRQCLRNEVEAAE